MKQDLSFYIKRIHESMDKTNNGNCRETGLTAAQTRILDFLHGQPEQTASQKTMEVFFGVSHPTISGIIRRMEQSGLVVTKYEKTKRASKEVSISKNGEKKRMQAEETRAASQKAMLKGFSKAETEQLEAMLRKLYENLRDDAEKTAADSAPSKSAGTAARTAKEAKPAAARKTAGKPAKK